MNSDYNDCRDAYFTCMDQFCSQINAQFRRCACSPRLENLRAMERSLMQTGSALQSFADLNITAIRLSGAEVTAITSATAGEQAAGQNRDMSPAAQALAGITDVLNNARTTAMATGGTLDIGGSASRIWMDSDMIGGADIANLSGKALYDQVHAQCAELSMQFCQRPAILQMVVSAYGMLIEQDCNAVLATLDDKNLSAQQATRRTERAMGVARLETHLAHNSTEINECIAQVRRDITDPSACGPNFVHCLDTTGMYLNIRTGAPIYSPNFYRLKNLISLTGDPLLNNQNNSFLSLLERNRPSAQRGLDTCRMVAEDVWTEFKRQTLVEIYQGHQSRIMQVRAECLDTLNQCFDEQLQNLRDFTNFAEQKLAGMRIELSEELCHRHLTTCSNLYGGGEQGLAQLRTLMRGIGTSRIADACQQSLQTFARTMCTPHAGNINNIHNEYPWDCRMLAPGGMAETIKAEGTADGMNDTQGNLTIFGHLYNHALDYCARPSEAQPIDFAMPAKVLADIGEVFDDLTARMRQQLRTTCEDPHFIAPGIWRNPDSMITNCSTFSDNLQSILGSAFPSHIDEQESYGHFCMNFNRQVSSNFDWGFCVGHMMPPEPGADDIANAAACTTSGGTWTRVPDPDRPHDINRTIIGCACPNMRTLQGNQCVCISNSSPNVQGICVCNPGYNHNPSLPLLNRCEPTSKTLCETIFGGTWTSVNENADLYGPVNCTTNTPPNCHCKCPFAGTKSHDHNCMPNAGRCFETGGEWHGATASAPCTGGMFGTCRNCPEGRTLNTTNCMCMNNQERCEYNSGTWHDTNASATCTGGTSGTCRCPTGTNLNPTNCMCR